MLNAVANYKWDTRYVGDLIAFRVHLKDPSASNGAYVIPAGATHKIRLPASGAEQVVEITFTGVVDADEGIINCTISTIQSLLLKDGDANPMVIIQDADGVKTTFETILPFKLAYRALGEPVEVEE